MPGIADEDNTTVVSSEGTTNGTRKHADGDEKREGVWTPPVGGVSRGLIGRIVGLCIGDERNGIKGVVGEVFEGLEGVRS